jgi:hypothetical protein
VRIGIIDRANITDLWRSIVATDRGNTSLVLDSMNFIRFDSTHQLLLDRFYHTESEWELHLSDAAFSQSLERARRELDPLVLTR